MNAAPSLPHVPPSRWPAVAPAAIALNDNPHGSAFVVLYQCDGDQVDAGRLPGAVRVAAPSRLRACRGTARRS